MKKVTPPPPAHLGRSLLHQRFIRATIALLGSGLLAISTSAQVAMSWQQITGSIIRPKGVDYAWNGSSMVGTATTASTSQTPAQSGGDWWYDVVEIKENGVVTGYVAVGYSGAPNWGYDDGCFTKTVDDLPKEANDGPLENNGNRHGEIRGAVARYRLDGTLDWYHSFYGGALMGVIQDSQGKLVMVGSAANSHADYFDDIVSPPDLALNPVSGSNTTPICTTGTAKRQMVVMKMNIDGSLEWNYLYNPEATAAMASLRQTDGMDLVETPLPGGAIGYRVVGDAARSNGAGGFDAGKQRPYIVQLDVSGNKLWEHYYGTLAGPGGWDEVQEGAISATAIDRAAIGGNSYYAVTGTVIGYDPAQTNGELFPAQAWLMYFNEPAAAPGYQAFSTYTTAQQVGNISGSSKSNDVKIREEANVPVAYWPVIGNLHGVPWAGVHYAEHGYVYKLAWNGTVPTASADLGELHAFDLQLGICTTADGNILATATKWPPGKSVATGNNYGYTDLTQAQVDALTAYRPGYNWNPALPPSPWATWYSFWGTQSYLAKLNGTDLSLVWDHQWTHGYSASDNAFAGNLRRRQCNFKVLEDQHGDIVVCGNTGHNFDDAYLAKLSPCDFAITPTTTYICQPGQTGSISLANSGSGTYTYQWSNGATTQAISGLAPGTYQVVATQQATGCAVTGTYTMPAPLGINFVNHYPCVSGDWGLQAVGTGGSGNFQYLWNYIYNSSPLNIPDLTGAFWNMAAPPPPLPPPAMVMGVNLTMYDQSTGCSYSTFPMLPSPETPVPVLGLQVTPAACTAGTLGAIHLNLDPAFAPYAFQWSTGATTADVSGLAAGTCTVTITYGQSCSTTRTITVGDNAPCCPADLHIPGGALSSTYGSGGYTDFSNTTIDIIGQFKVDNYLTLDNCTVYMEPGAEVLVLPGGYLRVVRCNVKSCKDRLWRSITASEGAYVEVRNSRVRDGEHAVKALRGATISVAGNIFTDNRTAIYVPEVPGIAWNNVAMYVAKNQFLTTGHLAQPYPGQATANGLRGYAAIDVALTTADLTGGGNVVDGLSNGIRGRNSNLDVAGFTFRNIRPDAAYNPDDNGSAIYAWGREGHYKLRQDGYGAAGAVNFLNCKWGVSTRYMNVVSRNNNMQGLDVAYRIRTSVGRNVEITDNRMRTQYTGMDLGMNDGANHFLVRYNQITFGDVPPTVFLQLPCFGIFISEQGGANPDSKVLNNTINFVSKASSFVGIGVQGAANWTVADNQVTMTDNALNRWGIATYGAFNAEVSCNQVAGNGQLSPPSFPSQGQAAIYNSMGARLRFTCNNMNYTANGMLFNGLVIDNADVAGNAFRRHKWALHLGPSAIIGQQLLRGNLWYNPPAAGGLGGWNENANYGVSRFYYNPALINGGNTEPPSVDPQGWFVVDNGTNYECGNDHGEDYCSQFHAERRPEGIGRLDELVARDSLQNDPYTAESKWMLKGALYRKLDNDPALRDSLPEMAAFYNSLVGSATAALKDVDDGQLALYGMDSTIVAQLKANRVQIEAYMALVKDQLALLEDSTLTVAQRLNIVGGISGYRQSMDALTAWNTAALQTAATSKVLTSEGLKAANAAIATSKLIEENEKQVNEIYLAVFGKEADGFTDAQRTVLYDIASQCPMLGGNAVYKARSMYRFVDDSTYFDDQLLCLTHGIIVKSLRQQEAAIVGVVPNPAKDQATLMLSEQLNAPAVFVIFNSMGSEMMRFGLPVETMQYEFSTGALSPALYHYQVRGPSGLIGRGKLTIIR